MVTFFAADVSRCHPFSFVVVLETSCVRQQGQGAKCAHVPTCARVCPRGCVVCSAPSQPKKLPLVPENGARWRLTGCEIRGSVGAGGSEGRPECLIFLSAEEDTHIERVRERESETQRLCSRRHLRLSSERRRACTWTDRNNRTHVFLSSGSPQSPVIIKTQFYYVPLSQTVDNTPL